MPPLQNCIGDVVTNEGKVLNREDVRERVEELRRLMNGEQFHMEIIISGCNLLNIKYCSVYCNFKVNCYIDNFQIVGFFESKLFKSRTSKLFLLLLNFDIAIGYGSNRKKINSNLKDATNLILYF